MKNAARIVETPKLTQRVFGSLAPRSIFSSFSPTHTPIRFTPHNVATSAPANKEIPDTKPIDFKNGFNRLAKLYIDGKLSQAEFIAALHKLPYPVSLSSPFSLIEGINALTYERDSVNHKLETALHKWLDDHNHQRNTSYRNRKQESDLLEKIKSKEELLIEFNDLYNKYASDPSVEGKKKCAIITEFMAILWLVSKDTSTFESLLTPTMQAEVKEKAHILLSNIHQQITDPNSIYRLKNEKTSPEFVSDPSVPGYLKPLIPMILQLHPVEGGHSIPAKSSLFSVIEAQQNYLLHSALDPHILAKTAAYLRQFFFAECIQAFPEEFEAYQASQKILNADSKAASTGQRQYSSSARTPDIILELLQHGGLDLSVPGSGELIKGQLDEKNPTKPLPTPDNPESSTDVATMIQHGFDYSQGSGIRTAKEASKTPLPDSGKRKYSTEAAKGQVVSLEKMKEITWNLLLDSDTGLEPFKNAVKQVLESDARYFSTLVKQIPLWIENIAPKCGLPTQTTLEEANYIIRTVFAEHQTVMIRKAEAAAVAHSTTRAYSTHALDNETARNPADEIKIIIDGCLQPFLFGQTPESRLKEKFCRLLKHYPDHWDNIESSILAKSNAEDLGARKTDNRKLLSEIFTEAKAEYQNLRLQPSTTPTALVGGPGVKAPLSENGLSTGTTGTPGMFVKI